MIHLKNILILVVVLGLFFSQIPEIKAQEPTTARAAEVLVLNIFAKDFGIAEPKLLPTSPVYAIKNIWRSIKSSFSFNSVKKAALKLDFTNERLIEAKVVAEQFDKPKIVIKTLKKYQKEFFGVSQIIEKIAEKDKDEIKWLVEKIIDHFFKQQRILDGIEKKLGAEYFEEINKIRQEVRKYFAHLFSKAMTPEEIEDKLPEVLDRQEGSEFKDFKNIEILKALKEKFPEEARHAIRRVQDDAMERLQDKMMEITKEELELFGEYVENIGGNEVRHLEIIHDLTQKETTEVIQIEIEKIKQKTIEKIDERIKEFKREEQQKEFLQHLEGGEIEDFRIIKELEDNLSLEAVEVIMETKDRILSNLREEFESIYTSEEIEQLEEADDEIRFTQEPEGAGIEKPEIELDFSKEQFSAEEIEQIKQIIQYLPLDIQQLLEGISPSALPEKIRDLDIIKIIKE